MTDITGRAVAERLSCALGLPVMVENRAGAATSVASTAAAQARPDGYTLLMGTSTLAINPALQPGLTPRAPMQELAPVGLVFRTAFMPHIHPSLPARGLAISSTARSPLLPDLPPVADALPGFDVVFWQGLFAPSGTPAPILARIGAALRAATDGPGLRARMAEQGVEIVTGDAEALRRTLAEETAMWGALIHEAGIKPH